MATKGIDLADQLRQAIQAALDDKTKPTTLRSLGDASGVDVGRLSRFMAGDQEKRRDLMLAGYVAVGEVLGLELRWVKQAAGKKAKAPH
jgi:hypothetical protein